MAAFGLSGLNVLSLSATGLSTVVCHVTEGICHLSYQRYLFKVHNHFVMSTPCRANGPKASCVKGCFIEMFTG